MNAVQRRRGLPIGLWVVLGVALVGLALYELRQVLSPLFFAFLIAYLLDPLVDRFEARKVPRGLGVAILLALVLGAIALVVVLVVPSVVREVVVFGHELPAKLDAMRAALEPTLRAWGVPVPHTMEDVRELLGLSGEAAGERPDIAGTAASALRTAGGWIVGGTSSVLAVAVSLLTVPVIAFYFLYDFDRMIGGIRELIPLRYRPFVVDVGQEVDQVLGQFIRGQLLVMLALAVLYSLAYSILGVRLAIPIGIAGGLLSFIPYVGGATALLLALLMCALSWQGWWQVGGVVIAYTIIQGLEGFVITPRVVGDKVGLPAIWVLIALMIGGEVFGFLGVLLAVPAAAVVKIFVVRALERYRKSPLYLTAAPEGPPRGVIAALLGEEGLPDPPAIEASKAAAVSAPAPTSQPAAARAAKKGAPKRQSRGKNKGKRT